MQCVRVFIRLGFLFSLWFRFVGRSNSMSFFLNWYRSAIPFHFFSCCPVTQMAYTQMIIILFYKIISNYYFILRHRKTWTYLRNIRNRAHHTIDGVSRQKKINLNNFFFFLLFSRFSFIKIKAALNRSFIVIRTLLCGRLFSVRV